MQDSYVEESKEIEGSPIKPLKPKRKEGLQTKKSDIVHTRDYYVKDRDTGKVFKFHTSSDRLQEEIIGLNVDSSAIISKGSKLFIEYKALYKKQNAPKPLKRVKKFIFSAVNAITPQKTIFKKGEEQKLTERGIKEKKAQYKYVQITDSTGLVHIKRVPAELVLADTSVMDYSINPKGEDGKRISRLKTRIEPPKSKGNAEAKMRLQQKKRLKSLNKTYETRKKLRLKRLTKKYGKRDKAFMDYKTSKGTHTQRVYKPLTDYMKARRAKIKQLWEERELRIINHVKKRVNKPYTSYADYVKVRDNWKFLRNYYSDTKREAYMAKMKEIEKQAQNGKKG